jgi:Sporulation and spore germination/Immunoglobulin-like domain of bacterial spore germination
VARGDHPRIPSTRPRLLWSLTGAAALATALGLLVSACDGGRGASSAKHRQQRATAAALSSPAPGGGRRPKAGLAAAAGRRDVTVYYLRRMGDERYLAPEMRAVSPARAVEKVAKAAVTELLRGRPHCPASEPPFPAGTRLLDLRVTAGTATVNLSRDALRAASPDGYSLQSLVWTLTQLRQVKRVVVQVEGRSRGTLGGRPLAALLGVGTGGRQLVRDQSLKLAPILLEEPRPRAVVAGDRVVVRGEAHVAGGAVGLRLRDGSGRVVSQGFATIGTAPGGWGRFSGALQFVPPPDQRLWRVEAFEASTVDASVTYSVAVPVRVGG